MNFTAARLRLAVVTAALAVAGILAAVLLEPAGAEQSTARAMAAARDHQAAWFATDWAELIGFVALAFTAVTVAGLVRGRGGPLTAIGGWVTAAAGLVIGLNGLSFAEGVLAGRPQIGAMRAAEDAINSSGALIPLLLLAFGSLIGPPLLAFGLWRAGRIGWWLPVLSLVGVAVYLLLGGGDGGRWAAAVVQLPLCAQIGATGWILLRALPREGAPVAATAGQPVAAA
jgi:hypothetical protein